MKKNSLVFKILIVVGIIIFAVIAFIIIKSTATVKAVVPSKTISSGTTITSDMLKTIDVPINTPKGYITDQTSLIGQKIRIAAEPDQLLYVNNFMTSWDDYSQGKTIPSDYVITAIQIPSDRAVGGLITAGDSVDILGIPKDNYKSATKDEMKSYLGDITKNSYGTDDGVNLYWILANVLILETDSDLSSADNSSISNVITNSNSGGAFYIVALSYNDYLKLRLAEQYTQLWFNIVPEQNEANGPMIGEMIYNKITALANAQNQSKFDKDGNRIKPEATESDLNNSDEENSSNDSNSNNSSNSSNSSNYNDNSDNESNNENSNISNIINDNINDSNENSNLETSY